MSPAPDIWFSAKEIAEAALPGLPGSKRGVTALAVRLGWDGLARKRAGRGGGLEYPVTVFPVEAQRVLVGGADTVAPDQRLAAVETVMRFRKSGHSKSAAVREAARAHGISDSSLWRWLGLVEGVPEAERLSRLSEAPEGARARMQAANALEWETSAREAGMAAFGRLKPEQQAVAEARAAVLRAVAGLAGATGLAMGRAREVFAEAWEAGEDDFGLGAEMRARVSRVSVRSLRRWEADFRKGGLAALAPDQGAHRKGKGSIDRDPEIRALIEGMLLQHPDLGAKLAMRAIRARIKGRDLPSYRTVQRWLAGYRGENGALLLLAATPDGFRSRARLVAGKADEGVLRLNQRWEMDSTPNDVMLSDGKRHALIGCIDVYTRRAKLLVTKSSNSAAVAGCLRNAILDWGVPEELKTDNGSDYASKHIGRVCLGLEIEQTFCTPFNPQEKPHIERFFHTFSHDLVELLDGFIGHSVEQRKAIEDRKAFAKRLTERGAELIELRMSAEELQAFCDTWCDDLYAREEHSSLGVSPFARAQGWTLPVRRIEDERALDGLLMPAPKDGGTRTVTKYGVSVENARYVAPELQPLVGRRVQVRLDEADWGRVLVLAEDGGFVCWAMSPERSGVSRSEFAGWLRAQTREIEKDMRAKIRAAKRDVSLSAVAADVLGQAREEAGKVVPLRPAPAVPHATAALGAAAEAAKAKGKPRVLERREDVSEAEIARLEPAPVKRAKETPQQRFARWERLDALVSAGEAVTETDARFWRAYQSHDEFEAISAQIAEFGREAVLGTAVSQGAG